MKNILILAFTFCIHNLYAEKLRLHPIISNSLEKFSIVSFGAYDDSRRDLISDIDKYIRNKKSGVNKLDRNLSLKVFEAFGLKGDESVFIYDLDANKARRYSLEKGDEVYFVINEAVDGLGAFGLKTSSFFKKTERLIAHIGYKNPFEEGRIKKITWKPSEYKFLEDQLKDVKEIKSVTNKFYEFYHNDLKIYLKDTTYHMNNYSDLAFGIQIRTKSGVLLKTIKGHSTYNNKPDSVWTGRLLKGRGQVVIATSTGMGGCGHFYIYEKGKVEEVKLSCGSWGC